MPKGGGYVWVHAVSVGEVQVAGQLMREWRKAEPGIKFCFSTTSSTGWKMAEREIAEGDLLIYNPLDFPAYVKSALGRIRPRAIVLTESELWPIFILKAAKRGIPLFLINARVSDRSAPRYRMAKWFFKDVLGAFTQIFAQSELDKERLIAAGAKEDMVKVTGSFKFDVARRNEEKEKEMREWVGEGKVMLGCSTWPGEDEVLIGIFSRLKERDGIKLVIAPRHFEKADAVEENIRAAGLGCVRRSRGEKGSGGEVYLADTTGELMGLCGIAEVVFVGKSLCAHGSQNMIEPCLCGKPTVVGPNTENFRPVMSDLLSQRAIEQVKDVKELEERMSELIREDGGLGERAAAAVAKRRGVVPKCVAAIRAALCLAMAVVMFAGCSKKEEEPIATEMCAAVEEAIDFIGRIENPDAEYEVVITQMNVSAMSARDFKRVLEAMPGEEVHVWMPGESDWVLVGHKGTNLVSLAQAMEVMAADVKCPSIAEVFASYVGTREEIMPAFEQRLEGRVVPEWFVPKEVTAIRWLDVAGIDEDILRGVSEEVRSMRVVRRLILEGNILATQAKDKPSEEKAIDCWTRAAMRNSRDSMLLERLEKLERNARGFLEVGKLLQAMKCFETMVLIRPSDAAAVYNFGMCLKKLGKIDVAKKVLERAEVLRKAKGVGEAEAEEGKK